MEFERKIVMNNSTYTISIPYELAKYYKINRESIMVIQPNENKEKKYLKIWVKKGGENKK